MCGEEFEKELKPPVSHQPKSVLEGFANCKVRDLHQVKDKLNKITYQSILLHHVIPPGTQFVGQRFVIMQDNDPKHTSKLCQRYIKSKK